MPHTLAGKPTVPGATCIACSLLLNCAVAVSPMCSGIDFGAPCGA